MAASAKSKSRSSSATKRGVQSLPIEKLEFDPSNPRIVDLAGERATQARIREILLGSSMQARELVPSFMENGYLPYEPLIVRPEKRRKHLVLEGNRRLAALLSMRDSDDPEESGAFRSRRLDRIPCIVFDGDEKDEIAYLGLRHLSKTKDWSAAAKASFVERILKTGRTLKDAGRITNTSSNNLRLLLLTRRLFEKAGQIGIDLPTSSAEGEITFWHLGDAIRRANTKRYLGIVTHDDPLQQPEIDESHFEQLLTWIYGNPKTRQTRLIKSIRDIPSIDRCLANERAAKVLEEGATIEEALEELQAAGATVSAHLERAKKSVQYANRPLSDVDDDGLGEVKTAFDVLLKAVEALGRELNVRLRKTHE